MPNTLQLPQVTHPATSQSSDKTTPFPPRCHPDEVNPLAPADEPPEQQGIGQNGEPHIFTIAQNSERAKLDSSTWQGFSQLVERVSNPPLPHQAAAAAAAAGAAATAATATTSTPPRTLAVPRQAAGGVAMPPAQPQAARAGAGDPAFAGSMHMISRACQRNQSRCPHQP